MFNERRRFIVSPNGSVRLKKLDSEKARGLKVFIQGRRVPFEAEVQEQKKNRESLARFWRLQVKENGLYSETISIDSKGRIENIKPNNDPFYIKTQFSSIEKVDDFYGLLKQIGDEYPDLKISAKENRQCSQLTYTVESAKG